MGSRTAMGVSLVAVAVMSWGCGGDGSAAPARPSKPAFIREADAICRRGNDALQREAKKFFAGTASPSKSQERDYVAKVFVPNIERQLEKLRTLREPKGDKDVVRAIWDEFGAGLAKIKARHAPPGPPPAEIKAAQRHATQYGFKVCGTT